MEILRARICVSCRILKKMVASKLTKYFEEFKVLDNSEIGFWKNHLTTDHFSDLVYEIRHAFKTEFILYILLRLLLLEVGYH